VEESTEKMTDVEIEIDDDLWKEVAELAELMDITPEELICKALEHSVDLERELNNVLEKEEALETEESPSEDADLGDLIS
jgi:predicted transcriptional regulator